MPPKAGAFAAKREADADKLRGGYYTPEAIAAFVASWVSESGPRLLEPSCGDGAILRHLTAVAGKGALGVELLSAEAAKASQYGRAVNEDFFSWLSKNTDVWDGVAGNPPYIRFGNWDEQYRAGALKHMARHGLSPSRLTNAWVPFVVAASTTVRDGGRVGLVLPAELLQVGYAAELRAFLVDRFSEITLVTFRNLVFEGVLQEVVLFLGTTGKGPARMRVVHVDNATDLGLVRLDGPSAPALLHDSEKWTKYFLKPAQIKALRSVRASRDLQPLGSYAQVQVGIVTGRNSFFTMTKSEARARGIEDLCVPLVARTAQLRGLLYSDVDLKTQVADDTRALLLLADGDDADDLNLRRYVREGEAHGVHEGYKCSIRNPWWKVPSYWVPDAFMFRQIHTHPRIVMNETGATSTDTIHRVRVRDGVSARALSAATFNSATFAYSEIIGRSYGGGIHELEPSEACALPVVNPALVPLELPALIDDLLRAGDLFGAVDLADDVLLRDGLGWNATKVRSVRRAWLDLSSRRAQRGRA